MNLALTGFMGAGKTTTGRRIATILRLPFADTDAEVEREHGSIAHIFSIEGEAAFRRYEVSTLKKLLDTRREPCVLAIGGGAVLTHENRILLRRNSLIAHLEISAETALARVSRRSRPLLTKTPDIAAIRELMEERACAYADHDFSLSVEGKSVAAVAHVIARWFERQLQAQKRPNGGA